MATDLVDQEHSKFNRLMGFRIGKWQVDPDAGSISDGGVPVQVPPRLMRLLLLLVDDAGKTVRRDALIDALWPRGFVNEEALSRTVNELRGLLGDDARAPKFIKTVPKRGYRLIAKVSRVEAKGAVGRAVLKGLVLAGLLIAAAALVFSWRSEVAPPADVLSTATRLTADPGLEWEPEISPGGQWVAQVIEREGRGAIQLISAAAPEQKREISHPQGLYSPVFSPDGSQLATLAGNGENCQILLWPLVADEHIGPESAVTLAPCYRTALIPGLDWSSDGNWLAIPARDPESGAAVLSRVRVQDGSLESVTRLSDAYQSDRRPRFSPDGRWLSFSRGTRGVRELWILDLADADGAPRQLTNDGQYTWGHDWWPDSQSIVMDSDRSGNRALWRLGLEGDFTLLGGRDAMLPSVSDDGSILFQVAQYEANIWALDPATGQPGPGPLIASTKYDSTPTWSPDGSEIAFSSNRLGDGGIWIAAADGTRVRMVYEPEKGRAVGPRWLGDGTALLASEYTPDAQRIVRIALNRREVLALQTLGSNPYAPTESPDRQWIYYLAGSDSGGSQLWRMAVGDSTVQEVVLAGPLNWYEIGDDAYLYFTRYGESGLWRRSLGQNGEAEVVLEEFPAWAGEDWTIHEGWIYHVAEDGLYRLRLSDGLKEQVSDVVPLSLGPSISVHPGDQTILLSKTDRAESDLFLARAKQESR